MATIKELLSAMIDKINGNEDKIDNIKGVPEAFDSITMTNGTDIANLTMSAEKELLFNGEAVGSGGGVTSWNDLEDRPFYSQYGHFEILPETQATATDNGFIISDSISGVEVGNIYSVTYNGVTYESVAQQITTGPIPATVLGDGTQAGLAGGNGEPFLMLIIPADMTSTMGGGAMVMPLDGATSVTIAISFDGEIVYQIDEKYIKATNGNILNGSVFGSVRTKGARVEDDEYTMGPNAFAEGDGTVASGKNSHAEGMYTFATGMHCHSEGSGTRATGNMCHAEGENTVASGRVSHAEGRNTTALGDSSHAEGADIGVDNSLSLTGDANATIYKVTSWISGIKEGRHLYYNGAYAKITSLSKTDFTVTLNNSLSHEALSGADVRIVYSIADGTASHSEGIGTTASSGASHAEGYETIASGANGSHAEGYDTVASGAHGSHAEGQRTIASGASSHAEGAHSKASGYGSHAEGRLTTASSEYQHVQGKLNIDDAEDKYAHIVGNGEWSADGNHKLSNAHTLDWEGNAWYAGDVEGTAMIVKSSTSGSTKRFKITVDDSGTITATEVTA